MKAFPKGFKEANTTESTGMDLRDYFAAKAMPLATEWLKRTYDEELGGTWSWDAEDAEEIAITAYMMADAMMKAKNETP